VTGSTPAGFAANTAVLTASSTGVEKISVATAGTNVFSITPTNTALTDYVALAVTGNGANTITASALTQVTTYDLSTSTGTNALNLVGALQTSTTVTGGAGTDTLRIQPATTVANVTVSGVETLRLSTGATTGNTFFTTGTSFATIRQDGDGAEGGAQTLNNVGAPTAINLIGAGTTALSGTAQAFNTLTVNSSWANASDVAVMKLSNGGTTLTGGIGYAVSGAVAATTLNGLEALTVEVTDIGATGATTFGGITGTTLSSLTATSAGHLVLGTITSAGALGTGTLTSINLSGVTGTTASTLTVGAATVGGALVITSAVNGTTVAGVGTEATTDSIIFSGNVGVDSFTGTGFLGSLVLNGLAGNDVLVGGSGADVITGGEGADTITPGLGNDTVILAETVSAQDTVAVGSTIANNGVDTITGFTTTVDKFNVDALGTAVALTTNLTYTHAANTVLFVPGQAAGLADASSAALITALNTAVTKTAAAANVISYIIVVDNNSSALYSVLDDGVADEYTGDTIVLMGTIDAILVAGDVVFA
jgi:Ca2+-binding RTX toxin-like protein